MPVETRQAYLRELRPDIGALNMGSMNYAKYSARRKDFVFKAVFENSFDTIGALLGRWSSAASGPSTSASTPGTSLRSTRCSTWAC